MPTIHIPRSNGRFDGNVPVQVNGMLMRIPIGVDYVASDAEVAALSNAGIPMQRTIVPADTILISTARYGSRVVIGINGTISYLPTGVAFVATPEVLAALNNKGIAYSAGAMYPFMNPEAAAAVARMAVPPSDARKGAYDTLFTNLKSAGIASKFDGLYLFAAHTQQAALLNLMAPDTASAVGAVTFTADRGVQGDGTTGAIRTGRRATDAGAKFKFGDCHFGGVIQDSNGTSNRNRAVASGGNGSASIQINGTGTNGSKYSLFDLANQSTTTPTLNGHYTARRLDASNSALFRNGSVIRAKSELSNKTVDATEFSALATGDAVGNLYVYSAHAQSALYFGSLLTDAEVSALYVALNRFLSAVGAEASI